MNFLLKIWDAATYFLFPPRCPACKEFVDERYQFCAPCEEKILRVDFYVKPPAPLEKVLRVTKYRDGSQKLLHKLKFAGNLNVLPSLKKILDDIADREEISRLLDGVDFAVPVPLHEKRLEERGFNQSEEIFREWLIKKNIPLKNLLIRTRATPKLYDKTPAERQLILSGVFAATEQLDLREKKILVVDDIYTTGTTAGECAKILKSLGAETVCVLAFSADFNESFTQKNPTEVGKIFAPQPPD